MDTIKKIFPLSFAKKEDVTALVVNILIYLAAGLVAAIVVGLLSKIPVLGAIISLLGSVVGLYMLAGIILTALDFLELLK